MIQPKDLIAKFNQALSEGWGYIWGTAGEVWTEQKQRAATREKTRKALEKLGFEVTESKANFLFARHPEISGEELYRQLKERGILIRHFGAERIRDYNRISVGTDEQMDALIRETEQVLRG